MIEKMDLKEIAAAVGGIGAAAVAFASSAHWPTALLIVANVGLGAAAVGMVRRELARQRQEISGIRAERHDCFEELRRARFAIVRLYTLLGQSRVLRGQMPSLDELFGAESDDAIDGIERIVSKRATVKPDA